MSSASRGSTAGEIILILIIARAAWGLIGPASARFETFVTGPRAALSYVWSILRGRPAHFLGHNPAGAAMIGTLLLCLAATTVSGVLMTTTALWGNGWIEWIHGTAATALQIPAAASVAGNCGSSVCRHRLDWHDMGAQRQSVAHAENNRGGRQGSGMRQSHRFRPAPTSWPAAQHSTSAL